MRSKFLSELPLDQIRDLASVLLASGVPRDKVIREVAAFADDLVDWRTVVKGLGGTILEAVDGALALALVGAIVAALDRG